LALAVPLSRFTPRVGGGSAFFVRQQDTLMKIYRILGILWLVINCIATVTVVRTLMLPDPKVTQTLYYCFLGSFLLLDLVGIVASISLIRGAKWARWFLGLYAIVLVVGSIGRVVEFGQFSVLDVIYGFVALVSAVILLMPRRYVAA
jgi:hypothetical protein